MNTRGKANVLHSSTAHSGLLPAFTNLKRRREAPVAIDDDAPAKKMDAAADASTLAHVAPPQVEVPLPSAPELASSSGLNGIDDDSSEEEEDELALLLAEQRKTKVQVAEAPSSAASATSAVQQPTAPSTIATFSSDTVFRRRPAAGAGSQKHVASNQHKSFMKSYFK
eukprot:GILI01027183.1.p1 GENE.GILI01027183.1~~GILI01027183.1.p1  ORF type:complete len:184 (+),score=45.85 GILI01027183.1:50-553(+)